ncbi:hypothetical protein L596_030276 [Steinernema carpocapsae]|uniref:Uncharacterized protein n=1 Tax=Steinernema carpocapsae TaxID=34508 RepID=A0A4V5ZWW0_STECR|nr:hypothetical protein L596_030276 [Steinernema carpocapsae]
MDKTLAVVSVAVGATVIAPSVIPALVVAFGVGTGGLAEGTAAAFMMVFSGSVTLIAVCGLQAIGALGAISTSVLVISGIVIGSTVAGFIVTGREIIIKVAAVLIEGGAEFWKRTVESLRSSVPGMVQNVYERIRDLAPIRM